MSKQTSQPPTIHRTKQTEKNREKWEYRVDAHDWFAVLNHKIPQALDIKPVGRIEHGGTQLSLIQFSPDGKCLACVAEGAVAIYGVEDLTQHLSLKGSEASPYIWDICFSPGGTLLATAESTGLVQLWDLAKKRIQETLTGHRKMVNAIAFSPNGHFLVSGSDDKTVRIWNLRDRSIPTINIKTSDWARSVAISHDSRLVAAACWSKDISIWDASTGSMLYTLSGHFDRVNSLCFTPASKSKSIRLISGSDDNGVRLWKIPLGNHKKGVGSEALDGTRVFTGHKSGVKSVDISPNGKYVISSSADQTIRCWDIKTGQPQLVIHTSSYSTSVKSISHSPRNTVFATALDNGRITIWQYELRPAQEVIISTLSSSELLKETRSLRGKEARSFIKSLDEAMKNTQLAPKIRARCLKTLQHLCSAEYIVPEGCRILTELRAQGDGPVASGGFADVWMGVHNGQLVAIKTVRPCPAAQLNSLKLLFYREAIGWMYLHHPNILPFIGVSEAVLMSGRLSIVSPWMKNGNLMQHIRRYPCLNRFKFLTGAVYGLGHMHSLDLAHGDLKGANVLINDEGEACLADFGLMNIALHPSTLAHSTTQGFSGGTVRYMAPELHLPEEFGLDHFRPTVLTDIYALGMVIFEALTGNMPFSAVPDNAVILRVVRGERPTRLTAPEVKSVGFTDDIWKVMTKCWAQNREERPALSFVLQCLERASAHQMPSDV